MNFQNIADSFQAPSCIISVQRTADGGYGEIRLVAGNAKYIEPIEHPAFSVPSDMPGVPEIFSGTHKFIPDSPYEMYLPKDIGFEDVCYRAAVKKLPIHTFVHLNDLDLWFDLFCLPLDHEDGDICYCAYTAQPSGPDSVGIGSSQYTSSADEAVKACIKLYGTNDLRKTMEEVVKDIRLICRADVCTIMQIDTATETFSVLALKYR